MKSAQKNRNGSTVKANNRVAAKKAVQLHSERRKENIVGFDMPRETYEKIKNLSREFKVSFDDVVMAAVRIGAPKILAEVKAEKFGKWLEGAPDDLEVAKIDIDLHPQEWMQAVEFAKEMKVTIHEMVTALAFIGLEAWERVSDDKKKLALGCS